MRLVSTYDEAIDKGTSEIYTHAVAFVDKVTALAGKPEGTYVANAAFYSDLKASVATLKLRSQAQGKNEITIALVGELATNVENLRRLHESSKDAGLPSILASPGAFRDRDQLRGDRQIRGGEAPRYAGLEEGFMAIDVEQLATTMFQAAWTVLKGKAPDVATYAEGKFKKIAQTIATVEAGRVRGQITEKQAELLLDMQKSATRSVLVCSSGMESLGGRVGNQRRARRREAGDQRRARLRSRVAASPPVSSG